MTTNERVLKRLESELTEFFYTNKNEFTQIDRTEINNIKIGSRVRINIEGYDKNHKYLILGFKDNKTAYVNGFIFAIPVPIKNLSIE